MISIKKVNFYRVGGGGGGGGVERGELKKLGGWVWENDASLHAQNIRI